MYTICNKTIAAALNNQLQLQNKSLETLVTNIILPFDINGYEDIKTMSLNIKKMLRENGIVCQHSKIINMIAKSLGFQNQHSLSKDMNLSTNTNKEKENISYTIDLKNDSLLVKLFKAKKTLDKKYEIKKWSIDVFRGASLNFAFIYPRDNMQYAEKVELNKFLKSSGLKPHKNTISIIKLKFKDIQDIAFNLVLHYRDFFTSIWYEGNNTYINSFDSWTMVSYNNIKIREDFICVDDY